mgnify:CR=1 FL=1
MDIREELKSAGVYPSGPCSAYPKERNENLYQQYTPKHAEKVKASPMKMAAGLAKTAGQAMRRGKVSEEIYKERMETCKACPAFIEGSQRCSDCGCYMKAKAWVGGDPDALCPQKKWER